MRNLLLLLIINLLGENCFSQQVYFSRNYETAVSVNYSGSSLQCSDSGFIFISSSFSVPTLGYSFMRTDKFGDTISVTRFIFSDLSMSLGANTHSLVSTSDGGYIASGIVVDSTNNIDGYLVKFTALGDTMWTRRWGGVGGDYLNSIYEGADNSFWICGSTSSQGNGLSDYWLLKVNSGGNLLWDSVYGTSVNEGAVCGEICLDGGFVISGVSFNVPRVVKVDSVGAVQWAFNYGSYYGYGFISQLSDSSFILACEKNLSAVNKEGALIHLFPDGTVDWFQYFGLDSSDEVLSAKPIILSDGIIIGGSSRPYADYSRGYLAKTDLNGILIWQRRYIINPNAPQEFADVASTNDGGFILAGSCIVSTQDAWLVKVDSMGCEVAGCDGVGLVEQESQNVLSIYPNPANENVSIAFSGAANDPYCVEIINSAAELVDQVFFNGRKSVSLSTEQYAEGIYFLRVMSKGECLVTEKLIILK